MSPAFWLRWGSALRTIQAGVDMASRGEKVVVGPGRYIATSGDIVVNIDGRSGGSDAPIEIIGDVTGARTGDTPGDVQVDAAGRPFVFRRAQPTLEFMTSLIHRLFP